ncbi:MAG: phytanoyl-CoA dioxygenase family protein [Pseudomonadales bacterium]|jgi:hypothetical protein|nr:phytanoyl-CoA dioxygenase family protein [Pseudomonadales bacterium]MDP7359787.1 phytanoyl-CoA dioxygenase family protein [Pseudomonadales bacterium]MDP7597015.1 phytanoyl-CoA dioxygenase family protein [Pseudomonadales bacterium]HJN52218.1 phytanoyl-CoA dioxygenase family protein [Pseudomonadales bacterium]|tara:strand:- start:7299 stop:8417 length:1119 start_codon:yes stop_codon:yes gene_type:complete
MSNAYFEDGARRAMGLGNRGPIRFNKDGSIHNDILDAYWRNSFYVLEGVVSRQELQELRDQFQHVLERAPSHAGSQLDAQGRSAVNTGFERATFQFAKPLSDPMGGTGATGGRYPVKMAELVPPPEAPAEVVLQISGNLQMMDSCLRLYGHPHLLQIAEAVNGPDFTPFTDAIWVKEAGLGAAVSWHQDGTTLWDHPDLDRGTHGFNFMAQLYRTTPGNALWIVPGSHDEGRIDIKALIENNDGSDYLPSAVPLLCEAGDVAVCSRQMLHGSFPNASPDRRVTFVFGFHRRSSVLGVEGWDFRSRTHVEYDEERIHQRSRIISLAIDARQQHFPDEPRYIYQPLAGEEDANRWSESTRESLLKDYNQRDLGI